MRIYDLFYDISTILGGIENKSYQRLHKVNDNEEKYIITKNNFNDKNLTKVKDKDANDKNRIIQCMKSISNHRFQNLNEVRDFRSRFRITSSKIIPVDASERLIVKKSLLSDNEIDFGNNLSSAKYEKNDVLHITSLQFDILKNQSVVETFMNKNPPNKKIKIYDLFSQEYSKRNLNKKNVQHSSDYVEWKHDCTLLSKLLDKGSNSSMVTLNVNLYQNHWVFFVGIDFYKGTATTNMKDNIHIYHFDSTYNSDDLSSSLNVNDEHYRNKFVPICRLLKLILLFGRNRKSQTNDMISSKDKKLLKIKADLYQKMDLMEDNLICVKVTYQPDTYTCGLHIIRFFDEILRIRQSSSEFSKANFEKELTKSKQLRLYNEENLNLKSELLEHYLNVAFIIGILTKSLFIDLVKMQRPETKEKDNAFFESVISDIIGEYEKLKEKKKENSFTKKLRSNTDVEQPAQKKYKELLNEVTVYIEALKHIIDDKRKCQCCVAFPKKQVDYIEKNHIQDIHDFEYNVLKKLRWTCPRTNTKRRGAFYTTSTPTKNSPLFELTSIPDVIKIWKPQTNWEFTQQGSNIDDWYKEFLICRLSFKCNFTEIKIPDGGSCSEWLVSTILLSEDETSEYGQYLNSLRKLIKIAPYEFSQDNHKTTKDIRLMYAESLYYEYSPNIEELLNLHIDDSPTDNELYCSCVLWNLHRICNVNITKYTKYVFQDCVRKFISLTPSQVGKFGCMWGTDDFLNWFQCLFNIRIFVINIQETDTQKYTTSSFVNELLDKGTQSYDEEHLNDKFFDLNIKNRLVPYGIMIVLMEGSHFDRVFKLHNRRSPIIPSGSNQIEFLLPLLKISKTLWSSLNKKSIYNHNSTLIRSQKMDINHELNFWFDHQFALEKKDEVNDLDLPVPDSDSLKTNFVKDTNNKSSSIPFCSIRFPPKYLAYVIYYNVLQVNEPYSHLIDQIDFFSINLQEEDFEKEINYRQIFREFIETQQKQFGKIENVFHDRELTNHISDMMEIYKLSFYQFSQTKITAKLKSKTQNNTIWTKRLQYPLFKNLLNIDHINNSISKKYDRNTKESKKRSIISENSSKIVDNKKLKISSNFSHPTIKLTLKSKDISVSNKCSKDDEMQMDSQKASDTAKSQSMSNSLDKNNEMNTSLRTESAIINTEKGDITSSKTTETSHQNESSIRKKQTDIPLSSSKNDQLNHLNIKHQSQNEKNAATNQSSSLKENTDVVSTSFETAKKSSISDPLLKSTNNSSQTKIVSKQGSSDPSDEIPPNPSFVINEDNETLPPPPESNKLIISKTKNDSCNKNMDTINPREEQVERVPLNDKTKDSQVEVNPSFNKEDIIQSVPKLDLSKTGKVLRLPKDNETDLEHSDSQVNPIPKELLINDSKSEFPKSSMVIIKNNNRPGKELRLIQENESENESDSTDSDDDNSSVSSNSSVNRFCFSLTTAFKSANNAFGILSSFETHPIRLNQLKQFKTEQELSETEGLHLDKLLLCSREVRSQKSKKTITYEGMYGFVNKFDSSLVNKNEINISSFRKSPYIWQELIKTEIGRYSKERSLEYLKGIAQDSQVLIQSSSIAWDFLESFFQESQDHFEWFEDIKQFTEDEYNFLDSENLEIDYASKNKKHKLIGDTPFTSCQVLYWKKFDNTVEFVRYYEDVLICVLMCFGPKESTDSKITFQLENENNWSDPIELVSNTIFVFSSKKSKFKIQGNLSFHLILLFCIDESTVKRIQKTFQKSEKPVTDWYSLFAFQLNKKRKSQSKKTKEISSKPENRKNRKRTGSMSSSRRVRVGYIDLEVSQKQEGTKRSCLQDAFINAGFLFGKNIKEEMYKQFPPMEKKNASLKKIIDSPVITKNFQLESEQFFSKESGGNEWRLLHHCQSTGVYIVWGTVQPTNRKKEYHAFVYNSFFSEFNNKKYYGAIIDNRTHSKLRAFTQEDLKDHLSTRKSLSDYFGGETRVNNWIRILDKI